MLLSLFACTSPADLGDVLPTEDQLRINLPTEAADPKGEIDAPFATYYALTRTVTEDVNGIIGFVLGTVAIVTLLPPAWVDEERQTAEWGPYQDSGLDPVATGLQVHRAPDGAYTWSIFQVPDGSEERFDIITGAVAAGATRTTATGAFTIDFDLAAELDPATHLVGSFATDYTYDPDGVAAVVTVADYGWEYGGLVDAQYAYAEDYAGAGEMDLAWLTDLAAGSDLELATVRSRWQSDGQGRSDANVTAGDLVDVEVTAAECWGSDFSRVYYTDSAGLVPTEGDAALCAFAEAEYATDASFTLR